MATKLIIPDHWPVKDPKRYRPIPWFVPYERNARTHPEAQIQLLAQLFKKYGPDQDIVVDEERVILKGHGRRLAAIAAGMKHFPFTQRVGLSGADKMAMRIADNQVALLAGWDFALVQAEIGALKHNGYDVQLLGFGHAQLVQFQTTPGPPQQFPEFGEGIETQFECPSCHYKWSGKPAPGADGDPQNAKRQAAAAAKR